MENQPNTDIEAKLRRFRDLCDRLVVLADRDDYLGEEYQRGLEETLTLLSEEPALRPVLVGHFIDSVRAEGYVPDCVIEHCMRQLRWPEVYDAAFEFARHRDPYNMNRLRASKSTPLRRRFATVWLPVEAVLLGALSHILTAYRDEPVRKPRFGVVAWRAIKAAFGFNDAGRSPK